MNEGAPASVDAGPPWKLRLYVAGKTARATMAEANLRRICEQHLPGTYEIEVVDLLVDPSLAKTHQIFALPTLVRVDPPPPKTIIGDLSQEDRVLQGLEIAAPRLAAGS